MHSSISCILLSYRKSSVAVARGKQQHVNFILQFIMAFRNDEELQRYLHSEQDDIVFGSDEDDAPLSHLRGSVLRGKNGHVWSASAPSSSRTLQRNIVNIQRSTQVHSYIETEKDVFMTLFSKPLDIVLTYTNQEIGRRAPKYKDQRFTHKTDKTEIEGLVGLLFYAAVNKDSRKSTTVGAHEHSCVYKSMMSENRFHFLLLYEYLFDDKDSRDKED